jgi:hypothetical protein
LQCPFWQEFRIDARILPDLFGKLDGSRGEGRYAKFQIFVLVGFGVL